MRLDEPINLEGFNYFLTTLFHYLKDKLSQPPVLSFPNLNGRFTVETDACDRKVRCVLLKYKDDETRNQSWYWYMTLNKDKRAYETTNR